MSAAVMDSRPDLRGSDLAYMIELGFPPIAMLWSAAAEALALELGDRPAFAFTYPQVWVVGA